MKYSCRNKFPKLLHFVLKPGRGYEWAVKQFLGLKEN
jgi:hypothetical protein